MNFGKTPTALSFFFLFFFVATGLTPSLMADTKKPVPVTKPAAPAPANHAVTGGTANHKPSATTTTTHTATTTTTHTVTTTHATPTTHGASIAHTGPAGAHDRIAPNGNVIHMRPNGHPMDVHDARRGMDIHHNLVGGRRVVMERPDHSRLYYERGRPGYIAHPYMFHGHEYYRRSYYYNGRAYDRFYNHYAYRGIYLDVYAPSHYYGVGFYGWAYHPWARPVPYTWGFAAAPWHGYYGAYFAPYPVYAAPSLWLTDYLISSSLAAAYEAHLAAQTGDQSTGTAPPAPLTTETKQLIANEVQGQIALENAEAQANTQHQETEAASSSIARILSDGQPHVFVAGKEVDLVDLQGQECAVTDGDVLQLVAPPAPDATAAKLVVLASKGGVECRSQSTVTVSFEDLQEMHNHMRETLDQGLQELQTKQGQGGLPTAPQSAATLPVTAAIAENAPPTDPSGAQELTQQAKESDASEQEMIGASKAVAAVPAVNSAAATGEVAQPTTVSLGQTTDKVKAAMGEPTRIFNLGPKTVYVYKDMKITFKEGKVSDVE